MDEWNNQYNFSYNLLQIIMVQNGFSFKYLNSIYFGMEWLLICKIFAVRAILLGLFWTHHSLQSEGILLGDFMIAIIFRQNAWENAWDLQVFCRTYRQKKEKRWNLQFNIKNVHRLKKREMSETVDMSIDICIMYSCFHH